jgi:hypothetical protein
MEKQNEILSLVGGRETHSAHLVCVSTRPRQGVLHSSSLSDFIEVEKSGGNHKSLSQIKRVSHALQMKINGDRSRYKTVIREVG